MQFEEFVQIEPEAPTTQSMTDEDIIDHVCTENDAPQEESEDEEDVPMVSTIKSTTEFLAIIDQQRAFLKRYNMPVKLVKQLETLIVGNQFAMCKRQKQVDNYFKSVPESPKPNDTSTGEITIVDSLVDMDMSDIKLQSIDTTVASVAVSALLRNEVTTHGTSTPKRVHPDTTTPQKETCTCTPAPAHTPTPLHPPQSMAISQKPVTLAGTSTPKCPCPSVPQAPKKKLKLNTVIDKFMNSDVSSIESSDSDLFSSQE